MTFAKGIGVLAISVFAMPYIISVTAKIPGFVDDGAVIIMLLSWVVSGFLDKDVTSSSYGALMVKQAEISQYTHMLKQGLKDKPTIPGARRTTKAKAG